MPDQALSLSNLAFRSKAHWGYSDDFMHSCRDELTYTADQIKNNLCYFLQRNKKLIGFYLLASVNQNDCELEALFVEPTAIRNGYGRNLIDHAKETARNKGYKKIIIQSDPNSVDFYLAVGSVRSGESPSASIAGRVLPMFELKL